MGRKDQPKSGILTCQSVLRKDDFIQHGPWSSCTATALWLHKSGSGLLNSNVCVCLNSDVLLFILCIINLLEIFGALSK